MVRMAAKVQEDTHKFVVISLGFPISQIYFIPRGFGKNEDLESRWQTLMSCFLEQPQPWYVWLLRPKGILINLL